MSDVSPRRRQDLTPFLLFPELSARGGGLQKAIAERSSLYARHYERVVILTTGFSPKLDAVVAELKQRGSIDPRVEVRNFFRDSDWVGQVGTPPKRAMTAFDAAEVRSKRQRRPDGSVLRIADWDVGERFPRGFRYYGTDRKLLATTTTWPDSGHERRALLTRPEPHHVSWSSIVADWVDSEMAGAHRPVLFSMKRGLNDQVLIASETAEWKVASLHNCHYADPEDASSGFRSVWRPLLSHPREVDEIVCLTRQQRGELEHDVPEARISNIPYPGRPPKEPIVVEKDPNLVVIVSRLVPLKRVDHAVSAFAQVVAARPQARLEIYGAGISEPGLADLIVELGLGESVQLMGYSYTVHQAQARAACTLMTSKFEGYARVISESMSLGTPVIAYDVRYGPRDLIRPGVDGVLVETKEPAALAEAIIDLLSHPERAADMGRRASEILERLPVPAWEQAWLDVLERPSSAGSRMLRRWRRADLRRRAGRRIRRVLRRDPVAAGALDRVAA